MHVVSDMYGYLLLNMFKDLRGKYIKIVSYKHTYIITMYIDLKID